jgi:hypothetical protein
MRADQVANVAVALCSESAKDTNGQIFAVRGNEVFLFNQPRPTRGMARLEGWNPETILAHCLPAMKGNYEDLGATGSVFTWETV